MFLSVSLSIKEEESEGYSGQNGYKSLQLKLERLCVDPRSCLGSGAALSATKHLWAGAFAAMVSSSIVRKSTGVDFLVLWFLTNNLVIEVGVAHWVIGFVGLSRTCIAPLERMKLEYIVRGEQRNLLKLIQRIATTEGIRGFWKGNLVNILRTAPFKGHLLKLSGNEETTNFERFIAGAAAGVTASLLCLPLDPVRTVMVAPGGEALGGLVPSLVSMAPAGAVFYGVYDILKSAYLHTPEGKKRLEHVRQEGDELNAFDQLELGPLRTLLYGAIAGACSEQRVIRLKLLSAVATCVKIVEHGGVPALYAGLIPSLLQVLPSAAISYFVYEFMKVVMKVESTQ
ncbi:hypothetical protein Bca4012_053217 [Brassica carinata]